MIPTSTNILPSNFVASTTQFMVWLYGQFQGPIILIVGVVAVGAIAGIIINHTKK